jgi:predicted Ser/Thr protein kinase
MATKGTLVDGRFELGEELAEGALGEVWAASDRQTGAAVVVKLAGAGGERAQAVLLREAEMLRQAHSPFLPTSVAVGRGRDGEAYSVTKRISGAPLGQWQRGASREAIRRVHGEVARALADLHGRGFVHRDVKPSNVLVTEPEGAVFLLDLGFAARVGEPDVLMGTSTAIIGTPRYLSPEVLLAHPLGPAADVYALGVMLVEALTGREPWSSEGTFAEVLMRRLQEPPSLEALAEVAPADVELVRAMLRREPEARPTAAIVAERLGAGAERRERASAAPAAPAGFGPPPPSPAAPAAPAAAAKQASPLEVLESEPASRPGLRIDLAEGAEQKAKAGGGLVSRPFASLGLLGAALLLIALGALLATFAIGANGWNGDIESAPLPSTSASPAGVPQIAPPKAFPIHQDAPRSPGWQSSLYAILGLAAGAALFYVYTRRRGAEKVASGDALVLTQRIAALEVRLSGGGALAAMRPDELAAAVQKSVLVALDSRPVSDVGRALELLAKQLEQGGKKPSWDKRITTVTGVLAAILAVASAAYALGTTLFRPNTPPRFEACGTEGQRALRDRPFELRPSAKDADGDPLTYDYQVSDGKLEPTRGPLALIDASAVKGTLLGVDIWVTDGRSDRVHTTCTIRVNGAPTGRLVLPSAGPAGSPVEVAVAAQDPDGDPLVVSWSSSCEGLGGVTGTRVFTRLPAGSCGLVAKVSDPWQSLEIAGELRSAP